MLIVDDEVDFCQILAWDFEDFGMKVFKAHGAWEALDILKHEAIDFVLSDVQMSEGDGEQLLSSVLEQKIELCGFYLMSGQAQFIDSDKFEKYGIQSIIKKPINTEKIIKMFLERLG